MAIQGLKIIGESINDSVPSTKAFYDREDWEGIQLLAQSQEKTGAAYLDINVGGRGTAVMEKAVSVVLDAVTLPLSIDSPDYQQAEAGLKIYDSSRGKPILNSISPLRMEMFDLYSIQPFRPILLISEFIDAQGNSGPARTVDESWSAAQTLFERARQGGIPNDDIIFDPGIAPIGTDTEGNLVRLLDVLKKIHDEPDMQGVHASVGLSNFTVMLPPKTKSAQPVKSPLESAFLTLAMPLGLDHVVGSVRRTYELLPDNSPAMQCVMDCIRQPGIGALSRVRRFYKS